MVFLFFFLFFEGVEGLGQHPPMGVIMTGCLRDLIRIEGVGECVE